MHPTQDDITSKVAAQIVLEIFKASFEGFKKADRWLRYINKKHDFFGGAARSYSKRIEERYNYVRIFGMSKPVPLRGISRISPTTSCIGV